MKAICIVLIKLEITGQMLLTERSLYLTVLSDYSYSSWIWTSGSKYGVLEQGQATQIYKKNATSEYVWNILVKNEGWSALNCIIDSADHHSHEQT